MKTLAILATLATLTACGGGEPITTECPIHPAAYIHASPQDIPLTGPETRALGAGHLLAIGRTEAVARGLDPAAVIVGPFAFCSE